MVPQNNELRFEVTTKCNYHCVMCPRDELVRKKETMSFDSFKFYLDRITSETSQFEIVSFVGFGEPLLDSTLLEKMAYARKLNYRVLLLTTASVLTMEKFKEMNEIGVESIRVSLHGNSVDGYAKTHAPSSINFFEKVKDLITDIGSLKRNTKIILTYVVTEHNKKDIESWVCYWKDKVDLIEVWKPHNWVDGRIYRKTEVEKSKSCGRPEKGPIQIQVDGTINMCCFDFNGQLLLGDLNKQSLKEIFNAKPFQKILGCHQIGDFKGSKLICENCDQRVNDKSDIMIYNSKFDISERILQLSTSYKPLS